MELFPHTLLLTNHQQWEVNLGQILCIVQVKKLNRSLSVVHSFAQEVNEIHQSIAELNSAFPSLEEQVSASYAHAYTVHVLLGTSLEVYQHFFVPRVTDS